MTYAIVARDSATGEMGAAVQTHFFNSGAVVLWAEAGVGVIGTMAIAETAYGRVGLELLREGSPAEAALTRMLERDMGSPVRQVGILGPRGPAVGHTGTACIPAAGHHADQDVVALGNMLSSEGTWNRMVEAFHHASGPLASRLLAALYAGERAGGDIRGMQSAGLVVVSGKAAGNWQEPGGFSSTPRIDLRVEDHIDPLGELERLLTLDVFYKELLVLLATPGLFSGPQTASNAQCAAAIETLIRGQRLLGDNPEAAFWLAILLARMGRLREARQQFAMALQRRAQLREMAHRLVGANMLSGEQFAALSS